MAWTRLFALTLILAVAACDGALRDPTGLAGGGGGGGLIGGGNGGGGGGGGGSVLLGSWQTHFLIQTSNDIQRHSVSWTFNTGGSCQRVVEIYSTLQDQTLTTTVNCTFRSGGGQVDITYEGRSSAVTFSWTLEHFSPDRLILDGVTYDRIG